MFWLQYRPVLFTKQNSLMRSVSVYNLERTNEQYIQATGRNLKTVLRITRIIGKNVYNIPLKLSLSYTIKTNLHIKVKYLD